MKKLLERSGYASCAVGVMCIAALIACVVNDQRPQPMQMQPAIEGLNLDQMRRDMVKQVCISGFGDSETIIEDYQQRRSHSVHSVPCRTDLSDWKMSGTFAYGDAKDCSIVMETRLKDCGAYQESYTITPLGEVVWAFDDIAYVQSCELQGENVVCEDLIIPVAPEGSQ